MKISYWHFILNPGLAVNELFFGQRLPKITCVCKACDLPLHKRAYVPCPNCGVQHDLEVQKKYFTYKNYFGLFCPKCNEEIPSLTNLTAQAIRTLTLPIWYFPAKHLKKTWLADRKRISLNSDQSQIENGTKRQTEVSYVKMGFQWGFFMCLIFSAFIITSYLTGYLPFSVFIPVMISNALTWTIGGVLFGLSMKLFLDRKGKKELHLDLHELMNRDKTTSKIDLANQSEEEPVRKKQDEF